MDTNFEKIPNKGGINKIPAILGRFHWMMGRFIVSFALGLVFALYFVGTITPSAASLAKLLAFSILLGYAAPRFWMTQDKVIAPALENTIKKLIDEHLTDSSSEESTVAIEKSPPN